MKTCVVCLVSDQTIPNVLIAANQNPDLLLLISTEKMEQRGKSAAILETLKLRGLDFSGRHHLLEVNEDSITDLQSRVTEWLNQTGEEYAFTVNLTGGTKLMSIAAFDLFADFGSEMVYMPIQKNEYLMPFPKRRPKAPVALPERLTVKEYLTAYGFEIENWQAVLRRIETCGSRQDMTCFLYDNYVRLEPLLKHLSPELRAIRKGKIRKPIPFETVYQVRNGIEEQFLKRFGFSISTNGSLMKMVDEDEREYLRGGWLEERLFLAVRNALTALPGDSDVLLGVVAKTAGVRNEFDVLFSHQNVLHLIECKSLEIPHGDFGASEVLNNFLYKIGELRQKFGLTPAAFFATTSKEIYEKDGELKKSLVDRAGQSRITVVPLLKEPDIRGYFSKKLTGM